MPRFTFVWWGDGYFVYDGEKYIGMDGQLDLVELLVATGTTRILNKDARGEPINGQVDACDTLTEMKEALS
jgi:hypothetical protein